MHPIAAGVNMVFLSRVGEGDLVKASTPADYFTARPAVPTVFFFSGPFVWAGAKCPLWVRVRLR